MSTARRYVRSRDTYVHVQIYADDAFGPPLRAAVQRHLRVQALARNNDDEPEPEESGDPVAPTVVAAGGGKPECLPLAFGE